MLHIIRSDVLKMLKNIAEKISGHSSVFLHRLLSLWPTYNLEPQATYPIDHFFAFDSKLGW